MSHHSIHHPNPHALPPGLRHVCMMEGPDPMASLATSRYDSLAEENKQNIEEIQRLRALLTQNGISSAPESSKKLKTKRLRRMSTRLSAAADNQTLPYLPMEIQLRILCFSVKSSTSIIDPFYRMYKSNMTKNERIARKNLNIQWLSTCKDLNIEGIKLLISNNDFIFTQAAAVANFAKFPLELRETITHVTFRVVGRYYDDNSGRRDLTDNGGYHADVDKLMIPVLARPPGMVKDRGIQAYCWEQLADFLKALIIPVSPNSKTRPKVFPNLKSLRVDLVNFLDHLPYGGFQFGSLIRWHLGQMLEELVITGAPDEESGMGAEEKLLHNLIKDGGLVGSAGPQFVSTNHGIKSLRPLGLLLQVLRADDREVSRNKKKAAEFTHPEGGKPPKSSYPPGRTVWKWAYESLTSEKKTWMEFDKMSGYLANDVAWSEYDEEMLSDWDGFDGVDEEVDEEVDEVDDEDDDEDDMGMPGLIPMF